MPNTEMDNVVKLPTAEHPACRRRRVPATVRLERHVRDALAAEAHADDRSLSYVINRALRKCIGRNARGVLVAMPVRGAQRHED